MRTSVVHPLENGFLLFIHPPGWKKPTDEIFDPIKLDITNGEYYKYDKKTGKQSIKQIRQGQVWQVLKDNGMLSKRKSDKSAKLCLHR